MPVLSLPLTFTNSFWSQDYRRGLDVLYRKLDQGLVENDQLIAFIRARSIAEAQLASTLAYPVSLGDKGFGADDGASLFMTFQGLQQESVSQSRVHDNVAKELVSLVINPFAEWAQGYKDRLKQSKSTVLDNWLRSYEQAQADVQKLKQQYLTKTRRADEAEDDAKFAPTGTDPTSPRLSPADSSQPPHRTASVSERISQRFREIQRRGTSSLSTSSTEETAAEEQPPPSTVDKGKQKAIEDDHVASPRAMSPIPPPKVDIPPEHIILGGVPFTSATVSQMLTRAASELRLRPVRFPLLGEYQDAFSGEEFITWLQESIKEFQGDVDLAEDAAVVLTEQEGLLRRLGELGNQFEGSDEAYYQFRPRAFDLPDKKEHRSSLQAENLLKRTNNLVNMVTKALHNNPTGEPPYIRARHDAEDADKTYRIAVRKLDRHRLGLEERLEETLRALERWETERLRAIKTVLLQYQGIIANIPKALEQSNERSGLLIAAYQPESDLIALIERYRTGPFRPTAQIYESVTHDEADAVFGIDLRKWAEGNWQELTSGEDKKDTIPPVITALLRAVEDAYDRLPNDLEKRRSWIYEVPLVVVHQLRETLNAVQPGQPFPSDLFTNYDTPVIANTIKLWLHELDPPLLTYEGWDEFRKIYPVVGTKTEEEVTEEQRSQSVSSALQKLPKGHIYVLDALIKHLTSLVNSSTVPEESDEVFIAKLALTLGRAIVRPKQETELSIQDRHPTLLFIDLMTKYESIIPPAIAKKKRESERKVPTRKRTAPVDMRLSRSRISLGADAKELLAAQQLAQNPSLARTKSPAPPLPDLPKAQSQRQQATAATSGTKPFVPPPPPPPLPSQAPPAAPMQVPQPPPLPTKVPSFKEPSPERDDLPPRPTFKEPPAEDDDYTPPPKPKFADPPAEDNESSSIPQPPAPSVTNVVPPSSLKVTGTAGTGEKTGRITPSSISVTSRSPSPPSEDVTLGSGKSTIARSGSGQSNGGLRGPRQARGSRRGGTVASAIANLNRNSVSGPSPSTTAGRSASPTTANNRFSTGSPTRKTSVLGRSAALSRRPLASDAEEDVQGRQ